MDVGVQIAIVLLLRLTPDAASTIRLRLVIPHVGARPLLTDGRTKVGHVRVKAAGTDEVGLCFPQAWKHQIPC